MSGQTCTSCMGRGKTFVLCALRDDGKGGQVGGPDLVPCGVCKGTGIDTREAEWILAGNRIRQERIAAKRSLREEALRRGIGIVQLSEMERGHRNPDLPWDAK